MRKIVFHDRGFTLVKLIMTILIMGIFVGIATLTYNLALNRNMRASRRANLRTLLESVTTKRPSQ